MKYIFRTLWLIGYIFIFIFEIFCFFIFPIVGGFYFIITGNVENTPFTPNTIPFALDNTYRKLLKYM